jgi:hypothetical protein
VTNIAHDLLSAFTRKSTDSIKVEVYQSKHIGEIIQSFESILRMLVDEDDQIRIDEE